MSVTVAHRPHIHLPWRTIGVFLVAAAIATAVLLVVNQPWEAEKQGASLTGTTTSTAVVVAKPEPWAMLRAHPDMAAPFGQTPAAAIGHSAAGATHAREGNIPRQAGAVYIVQAPAPRYPPGAVDNARPLNFTAGGSR